MNQDQILDLYSRLIVINRESFEAELYHVALHALEGALQCAKLLETDERLNEVSHLALEQKNLIDQDHHNNLSSGNTLNLISVHKSLLSSIYSRANAIMQTHSVSRRARYNNYDR